MADGDASREVMRALVDFSNALPRCPSCGAVGYFAAIPDGEGSALFTVRYCCECPDGDVEEETEDLITLATRESYQRGYADAAARCGKGWVWDHEKQDWREKRDAS